MSYNFADYPLTMLTIKDIVPAPIFLETHLAEQDEYFLQINTRKRFASSNFELVKVINRSLSTYVIYSSSFVTSYLAAVYSSLYAEVFMFPNEGISQNKILSRLRLTKVKIRRIPYHTQMSIGACNQILNYLRNYTGFNPNARYRNLMLKDFEELQDIMIAEIHFPNRYKRHNLLFVELWESLISSYQHADFIGIWEMYLFYKSPACRLYNNVKMFRILITRK